MNWAPMLAAFGLGIVVGAVLLAGACAVYMSREKQEDEDKLNTRLF